ncbi:MAG: hypothetical protein C5B59_07995 [Bacteroidetes bacterium]|nr:MAG: hypothetical protein C5B59_07995 [Bacteroidota bacterium]
MGETNIRGKLIKHYDNPSKPNFWQDCADNKWESEGFDLLDEYVLPGTAFIDIGAWNGVYSLYAHAKGAQVFAIEPDTVAYTEALENFKLNGIERLLSNIAITDRQNMTVIYNRKGEFGNSESSLVKREGYDSQQVVPEIDLEYMFALFGVPRNISLIKIDTEGSEAQIIPSSVNLIRSLNCPIYLALHPHILSQKETRLIIKALKECCNMERTRYMIHDQMLLFPKNIHYGTSSN